MQPVLSLVLNRKKGISVDVAASIAERLRLADAEASYFGSRPASMPRRIAASASPSIACNSFRARAPFSTLQEDVFHAISDWYHFALFELTAVTGFRPTPSTSRACWHQPRRGQSRGGTYVALVHSAGGEERY